MAPETIDERGTSDRWERLKDVVADALELPATERLRLLEATVGDDPDLYAQALDLIDAAGEDASMLDPRTDAFIGLTGPDTAALDGRRFGKYQLIRLLGEGAMASVYLAHQDDVNRPVALKVFRPHALGHDALLRFRREVDALGRIEHPFVARIFEADIHYDIDLPGKRGLPYIAMEYVDGLPVTHFAREHRLTTEQRIRLIADIADAVHAAHQKAIVHRDLKPGNVLVAPDGKHGTPKVLDFGIARVLEEVDPSAAKVDRIQTLHTTTGVLLGTLGYMAPEQASGDADKVDTRADVFALGVMLHELLTGKRPVETDGLPLTEVLRRLSDPVIPPAAGVDGDLRTILQTALDPVRARRYPSAEAFADDLRRSLRHEPIVARPPTTLYLLRKFVRRNRLPVFAAAAVLLALVGGAVAATVGFVREAEARRVAETEAERALRSSEFLRSMLVSADPGNLGRDVTVLEMIRAAEPMLGQQFQNDPDIEANLRGALAQTLHSLGYIGEADVQYERQVELARRVYGPHSESAIATAAERAGMLINAGLADEATAVLDEYRAAAQELAPSSRGRILFDEAAANLLLTGGDYNAGTDAYRDVYDRAALAASIDPALFDTLGNNYALALAYVGDYAVADEVYQAVIQRRTQRLGSGHLETLKAKVNHANVLLQFRPEQSVNVLNDAVPRLIELLGKTHPTVISARRAWADALSKARRDEQAIMVLQALLEDCAEHGDAELMPVLSSLGSALSVAERYEEAGAMYQRALDQALQVYGPEHPDTLVARGNLAIALGNLGDNAAAREQLRTVLEIRRRTLGPENIATLINMNNLAMVDLELGRYEEAVSLLRQVLTTFEAQGLTANTPIIRRNLGRALTQGGAHAEAEQAFKTAFTEAQQTLPVIEQAKTAKFFAELYEKWGKPDEAKVWREIEAELAVE